MLQEGTPRAEDVEARRRGEPSKNAPRCGEGEAQWSMKQRVGVGVQEFALTERRTFLAPEEEAARRERQQEPTPERACRHRANRGARARQADAKRQRREDEKNIEV